MKIRNSKLVFLTATIGFFSTGCASLVANVPGAQVQSSETAGGESDFGYKVGNFNIAQYKFTSDASARPPNLSIPDLTLNNLVVQGDGLYSFNPRFDASLFLSSAGNGIGAKYQLLGPAAGESKTGDYSLAVFGRTGFSEIRKSGNQNGSFGPGGFSWQATARTQFTEGGLSFGKKTDDETLVFLGLSTSKILINGDIKQDPTADGVNLGGKYSTGNLQGQTYTAALGLDFGQLSKKQIQVGATQYQIGEIKTTQGFANFSYQYSFAGERLGPKKYFEIVPKDRWQGGDFGAVALSYLVGVGTGQAAQGRWDQSGKYFAMADGASLLSFASTLSSGESNFGLALGIYAVSRIWQIVDVIVDASSGTKKREIIKAD